VDTGLLTPAVVSSVRAHEGPRGVEVEWETASEVGTAGFDLMRWDPETRAYVTLNKGLLPGLQRVALGPGGVLEVHREQGGPEQDRADSAGDDVLDPLVALLTGQLADPLRVAADLGAERRAVFLLVERLHDGGGLGRGSPGAGGAQEGEADGQEGGLTQHCSMSCGRKETGGGL
jgi:hypothetical protein